MPEEPLLTVIGKLFRRVKNPRTLADEFITVSLGLGLTPATIAAILQQLPGGTSAVKEREVLHQLAMRAERRFRDWHWRPMAVTPGTGEAQDRLDLQRYLIDLCNLRTPEELRTQLDLFINAVLAMGLTPDQIEAALLQHLSESEAHPAVDGDLGTSSNGHSPSPLEEQRRNLHQIATMARFRFSTGEWCLTVPERGSEVATEIKQLQDHIVRVCGLLSWQRFFDFPGDAVLVRGRRESVELTLVCEGVRPDARQLFLLRKLLPSLREPPPAELREQLSVAHHHRLGKFDPQSAARIQAELSAANLSVVAKPTVVESMTAFDRRLNLPVIMVNTTMTQALVDQMLADGVPVVDLPNNSDG